jgi:transposase
MPSALSVDLRERVVAAIEAGASRRGAARRFGVSASSAIRWHASFRQEGQVAPKPMGGDQRSRAIEAQTARVVALSEERPESFLRELRDALAGQGVTTSTSGLSRFFRRHAITRKKRLRTRPSRNGRT